MDEDCLYSRQSAEGKRSLSIVLMREVGLSCLQPPKRLGYRARLVTGYRSLVGFSVLGVGLSC
jgi:hypothetical protein